MVRARRAQEEATPWASPIDLTIYDRAATLSSDEMDALQCLGATQGFGGRTLTSVMTGMVGAERIVRPLRDALAAAEGNPFWKERGLVALLRACLWEEKVFWGWDETTWARMLAPETARLLTANRSNAAGATRHYMIAAAYLLGCLPDISAVHAVEWSGVAWKVFGRAAVMGSIERIEAVLAEWGYADSTARSLRGVTAKALLVRGSPCLETITDAFLSELKERSDFCRTRSGLIFLLSRALRELGIVQDVVVQPTYDMELVRMRRTSGVDPEWVAWTDRWCDTSTLAPRTRSTVRHWLFKTGRWLQKSHPDVVSPDRWTRALAIESIAWIDRSLIGDFTPWPTHERLRGQPLSAATKSGGIAALRRFFRDVEDWGWARLQFTPLRVFSVPKSIRTLIGPSPRTIADDLWAKLLWAGLNLERDDLPQRGPVLRSEGGVGTPLPQSSRNTHVYPIEMVRALALVWLFSGLRNDEISRLPVGCVRWQEEVGAAVVDPICLLDVPVNKTSVTFTKPVDPLVGKAIASWEAVRPRQQPRVIDRKTGLPVSVLFGYRGRKLGPCYINRTLIPVLCRKAGIPRSDARGAITSHRARSTIASQLYNAKDPMSLFELQAWLGHRSPESTQHYARITPTTLARAYSDAGYFSRNVRTIAVLIDRDEVVNGDAAQGHPWQFFDLGHGFCSYTFFEQCPHRMACARCDFYIPKGSTKAQLLEAKGNLQRMLVSIPLTDEERAAVDDGAMAVDLLLNRLADIPTPAGPTPRDLAASSLSILLPVVATP